MHVPKVDRRGLLIGGGAIAGLVIAFTAWPRIEGSPLRAREGEKVFGPFLRIATDGRITIALSQTETGQGAWTGLAQILADELGAAWENVSVEPAPLGHAYANPLSGPLGIDTRLTALATSVRAFEKPLRAAGATARTLLCAAAARRWGVAAAECDSEGSMVVHEGKRLPFGVLAAEAAAMPIPERPPLRADGSGRLMGQPVARLDVPAKSDGGWRFAADVRLPGMMFASVRMAPPEGRLAGWNRSVYIPGVRILARDRWIAAVGPSWWAAEQALVRAEAHFAGPVGADSPTVTALLEQAMADGKERRLAERGDYSATVRASRPLSAVYSLAPAPHLSLEPPAAVARITGDRLEIWTAALAPDLARAAVAEASGFAARQISFYPMPSGDSGGRALDQDAALIAVDLAMEFKRPIALTLPAATGQNQDALRPPMLARMSALPHPAGGISAWRARIVGANGLDGALSRLSGNKVPPFDPRGAVPPYAIPALRIDAVGVSVPFRTGYLRGDMEAMTAFLTESFIDELARARGAEPLAFRIGMLSGRPRLARAIMTAAAIGGWDGGGVGSAMGLACASAFGSHIGLLVEASLGSDQRVGINRMVAAVDCGRAINPALVRQQVEAQLVSALTTATGAEVELVAGVARARTLGALGLGRLTRSTKIEVELLPSDEAPGGVSGLADCVLAAATGNAIQASTGQRLRHLPFNPMSGS